MLYPREDRDPERAAGDHPVGRGAGGDCCGDEPAVAGPAAAWGDDSGRGHPRFTHVPRHPACRGRRRERLGGHGEPALHAGFPRDRGGASGFGKRWKSAAMGRRASRPGLNGRVHWRSATAGAVRSRAARVGAGRLIDARRISRAPCRNPPLPSPAPRYHVANRPFPGDRHEDRHRDRPRSEEEAHPRDRAKLGIPSEHLLPYGHDKAKIGQDFIKGLQGKPDGKLILVTAINPTPAARARRPPPWVWATG